MSSPTPTAYPLCWPTGWPRTDITRRQGGGFKTSMARALSNLRYEINLMGGKNVVLSSNCALGQENPEDPGVCAYFFYEGMQLAIPCDRWWKVEHNVQAIALTIEAMRGMKRWGANHMIRAMFSGFKALPAGDVAPWHEVLGVAQHATAQEIQAAYRAKVKEHHPDKGGERDAFVRVQRAYEQARTMGIVS